jgi:galactofuranosylgalactofuranosylrhamnosyl-N-acetylglucosaminyl-diphospho-decaprenol beta-1,5/1,6-galactofuranosyltransferase
MVQESFNHQVKHLVSMQYSTVELRHQALLDVLEGPGKLHENIGTKLPEIRNLAKQFTDAQVESDRDAFPEIKRTKLPRKGREGTGVPSGKAVTFMALTQPLRQLKKPRQLANEYPEAEIPAQDAKWYRIARYDSAVVSMPDGTSAAFYKRDPKWFQDMLKRTVDIHLRLRRDWEQLAEQYRAALPEITSPEAWEETFRPWLDESADD